MITNQDEYNAFVARSPAGTIFGTTWWLDAVAPESYEILTVRKGSELVAAWPIIKTTDRLRGLRIGMPPLTPWLGILFRPVGNTNVANRLKDEKDLAEALVAQLPRFQSLHVRFHRGFTYWLPLYWKGFAQTTRYTYVLEDLADVTALWGGLRDNIRTDIRKAKREGVSVECVDDLRLFWDVHRMTFERQNLPVPYTFDLVQRIDAACRQHGSRRIFVGRDSEGKIHAGAYIIWDRNSAYYVMGGANPLLRTSGAASLVLWEAIQFAATVTNAFDFEGSMIEPVERFFRSFGARPCPYFAISKVNSPLAIAYQATREIIAMMRPKGKGSHGHR
ncbi:MAG: GNAT family N-acetyltransferase [Chloroflexales bacterium]